MTFRAYVQELAALSAITLFLGMIAVWTAPSSKLSNSE